MRKKLRAMLIVRGEKTKSPLSAQALPRQLEEWTLSDLYEECPCLPHSRSPTRFAGLKETDFSPHCGLPWFRSW